MTNTPQTEPMSLLDGVEPDGFAQYPERGQKLFTCIRTKPEPYTIYATLFTDPIIFLSKVEALLEAQRAEYEARIDANRKQVLLEVMELVRKNPSRIVLETLRRMAEGKG
jgi:hypothetical protein